VGESSTRHRYKARAESESKKKTDFSKGLSSQALSKDVFVGKKIHVKPMISARVSPNELK
jgi:hypothetical protein